MLVKGLAGGRNYDIALVIYPKETSSENHHLIKSHVLSVKSPLKTCLGGPIISLKENFNPCEITLTWLSINSHEHPISNYELYVNDRKNRVVS